MYMSFGLRRQEPRYCRRLWDAIGAKMEVKDGNPQLQC